MNDLLDPSIPYRSDSDPCFERVAMIVLGMAATVSGALMGIGAWTVWCWL
jgi:uncharacterized membrane protein